MGIDDLDLLAVGAELSKQAMAENIYIPRTFSSNSLVYYLLGLSNVNPLPRHTVLLPKPMADKMYWYKNILEDFKTQQKSNIIIDEEKR